MRVQIPDRKKSASPLRARRGHRPAIGGREFLHVLETLAPRSSLRHEQKILSRRKALVQPDLVGHRHDQPRAHRLKHRGGTCIERDARLREKIARLHQPRQRRRFQNPMPRHARLVPFFARVIFQPGKFRPVSRHVPVNSGTSATASASTRSPFHPTSLPAVSKFAPSAPGFSAG